MQYKEKLFNANNYSYKQIPKCKKFGFINSPFHFILIYKTEENKELKKWELHLLRRERR